MNEPAISERHKLTRALLGHVIFVDSERSASAKPPRSHFTFTPRARLRASVTPRSSEGSSAHSVTPPPALRLSLQITIPPLSPSDSSNAARVSGPRGLADGRVSDTTCARRVARGCQGARRLVAVERGMTRETQSGERGGPGALRSVNASVQ